MKKITILFLALILPAIACLADNPYDGEVRVDFAEYTKTNDLVTFNAVIDLGDLGLGRNQMVTFTPALRSLDGSYEVKFEQVVVAGKRRAKSLKRTQYFRGTVPEAYGAKNFTVVARRNRQTEIPLSYTLPFEKWMRSSQMVVVEQTSGCCNDAMAYADGRDSHTYAGAANVFPEPYKPVFTVSYVTPPVEAVKVQSDTYSARLQFQVNKSDLLKNFGDNARILAEADGIISRVKSDTLLTIRHIGVKGYASPEGNAASNMRLSRDRAQAFVNYLYSSHGFNASSRMITSEGLGEDWAGLREAVGSSWFGDREKVLAIIDGTADINRRKSQLRGISGGRTYRMMLENMYPPLRRNEYTIEYEIRGFTPLEAREVFRTRPQLLSLNEMFMVANLYERDSEEFRQVFDVAARLFPDSQVAQLNVAAMEIDNGSYDTAVRRLADQDSPEALNNMGVAYWAKGEYEQALGMFRKAADKKDANAPQNIAEYEKWIADRDE